jgi:hypothetical protein
MKQKYLVEMRYEVYYDAEVEAESEDEAEMLALEEIKGRKDLPQGDENWFAEFTTVIEEGDEDGE